MAHNLSEISNVCAGVCFDCLSAIDLNPLHEGTDLCLAELIGVVCGAHGADGAWT